MENKIIDKLIKNIINGKVVSFPTETFYSLSCDMKNNDVSCLFANGGMMDELKKMVTEK